MMDHIMARPSRPEAKIPDITGDAEEPVPHMRICAAEGCRAEAHYRAPRSRDALRDYIWFCLEHVRAYNRSWNYYEGLQGAELEAEIRRATTWERPSWKFGTGPSAKTANYGPFEDKFSFFDEPDTKTQIAAQNLTAEEKKAYALLELEPCADEKAIKQKYKALAKKLHPDHNRSDPTAEDRLKEINLAYAVLRKTAKER